MRLLTALAALIITTSCGGAESDSLAGTWALIHCATPTGDPAPCIDGGDPDISERLRITPDGAVDSWRGGDPDSRLSGDLRENELCLASFFGPICYTAEQHHNTLTLCLGPARAAYERTLDTGINP